MSPLSTGLKDSVLQRRKVKKMKEGRCVASQKREEQEQEEGEDKDEDEKKPLQPQQDHFHHTTQHDQTQN